MTFATPSSGGLAAPIPRDKSQFATPILLLVFNRPETTREVVASIRSVRPLHLYVAGDGPRANVKEDEESCAAARQIATKTDWDCSVHTLFREVNLGCGLGVSSAVTWFFEHVTEGIVLEDDCVPSPSFYGYCQELLDHYREEERVMHVGGSNFQYGRIRGRASYYFSRYAHIWGWATWRRAWKDYDFNLRPPWLLRDTWDTQWQLSIERSGGVAIVPNVNLVENVGFGVGATHTTGNERASSLTAGEIALPLTHPASTAINIDADRFTYYVVFRNVRFPRLIWVYGLWDWLYSTLKSAKRMLLGLTTERSRRTQNHD